MTTRSAPTFLLALAAIAAAPAARSAEGDALPPPAPGREVVLDSRVMVGDSERRQLSLSDLDPETADTVREINRKPGTWQMYLLYTAEDLPERMFHPGFAIRFPARRVPVPPELPLDEPPPDATGTKPSTSPAPAARPVPASAPAVPPPPR
jgi:hypothetical protein